MFQLCIFSIQYNSVATLIGSNGMCMIKDLQEKTLCQIRMMDKKSMNHRDQVINAVSLSEFFKEIVLNAFNP